VKYLLKIFLFITLSAVLNHAETKYKRIISFNNSWKFSLGDNLKWADPNFNDNQWSTIQVPSPWENEGYNGYNGFAWYRKKVEISDKYLNQNLFLSLGSIDDAAEIYINGVLIGVSGSLPPNYVSAFNKKVWLQLPSKILNKNGKNLIAVRVYDSQQAGGIYSGDIGVFVSELPLDLLINLEGDWKFKTGDNIKWKETDLNDNSWNHLFVPLHWDSQGYKDYDGFAWYRLEFDVNFNKNEISADLIVLLGKIDDVDQTFLNGNLIGSTGDLITKPLTENYTDASNIEYKTLRGYRINKNVLKNGRNVLAIRVFDGYNYGGIYEGPIGITTFNEYLKFITKNLDVNKKNFIELLFE
jgi:sialate O-acetylesterase